ncbi:MAG: hypothetical protein J6L60_10990, partial [Bacteroidaceae bacterium]|nr:hypothetical protein [Bacteroidaceae bacterium]
GHAELVSASVRSQGLVKARSEILKQVQDDIWRYLLLLTHFGAANSILMFFCQKAHHSSLIAHFSKCSFVKKSHRSLLKKTAPPRKEGLANYQMSSGVSGLS